MIFNVEARVIHLVEADSPEQAREKLRNSLTRAGFEVDYRKEDGDVFESEEGAAPEPLPGGTR